MDNLTSFLKDKLLPNGDAGVFKYGEQLWYFVITTPVAFSRSVCHEDYYHSVFKESLENRRSRRVAAIFLSTLASFRAVTLQTSPRLKHATLELLEHQTLFTDAA